MELSPSGHTDTFCRDNLPPFEQWPEFRFELSELQYSERLNAAEALLDGTIATFGADRACLRSATETWSYGDVLHRANQVAQVLTEDFGLVPGNRVLLRGPNNPWLVAAWFGVLKAGGVAVTTMALLRTNEIRVLAELTGPALAICDHRFTDELAPLANARMPMLSYDGTEQDDLVARCASKSGAFNAVATAADDVALLAPTSGTTGQPKATMHFHRDILAIADTFSAQVLRPLPDDVFAGTPPLGFTFGLGGAVVFPMRCGASTLLLERATPVELADAIAAHGVSVVFTAPTAYKAMLTAGAAPQLRSLRRCVSAGEHLPATVSEEFHHQTGIRIIDGIGATELLHIFISAADEDIRPGSTGKPVPGYQARIVDGKGVEVPDGTPGRLAIKGPTGCRYLADERQARYAQDGWNLTGDTYIRDSDGYFWYQARSDDMIVSSGYNIAAPEVEQALLGHPEVAEAAVIDAPDEARGSLVKAYVVLAEGIAGHPAKARELQDFVKQAIAPYKYPRAIEFVTELPRTRTGKIQRYRLREREGDPATVQSR
ncbi:MAG: AMP-binding protein [Pseudonocardiaceae bacterium]|nr:AMP-binding protein [Pseudonocardiaceae bacterium]